MEDNLNKIVVTEGDSIMNTVTSLGEIKHLVSYMTNSIKALHAYVLLHIDHRIHKRKILKQINILIRSINFLDGKILFLTGQQGMTNLSSRIESRKRSAFNLELK